MPCARCWKKRYNDASLQTTETDDMPLDIEATLAAHNRAVSCIPQLAPRIHEAAERILRVLCHGGQIYICGNGGSAADSQHFAAELAGRFERERRGLSVIALTTDTSALTSIGNDYGFEHIFRRQLEALARPGELLIAISTSGNSPNIIKAVEFAREHNIQTVGLLGRDGGRLASLVDVPLTIPAENTARIQEAHIVILHMLCEAVESGHEADGP